jgi:hypothetical protein
MSITIVDNIAMNPIIRKAWKNNRISSTVLFSLPHDLALKHGIKEGTNIAIYDKPDSIVIKKLEVK